MLFSEDKNSDQISENMEQEDKVNIEQTAINLGYVKKELEEEELEFEEKQYKIALNHENIFGKSSSEQRNNRDSLIGFLDGDVIMETGSVKLEDVKEENKVLIGETIGQSHCNQCGGNYTGYCPDCSSLSHILNNLTPNIKPESILNTAPINVLEIREVSTRQAVFALKTLPIGIILGPFEGVAPIECTIGLQWKIKDKKFVNDQNGNWMKYIGSVANHASKNLDVFQIDGILYFVTSREIQEGEELLVCYREEKVLKSDEDEEFYLVPVKKEGYPKVFACTFCCLGFRLERCLVEHKSKCPQGNQGDSIEDFEIIQCRYCKVWLEKREHVDSHLLNCLEKYNRLRHNTPDILRNPTEGNDKTQGSSETPNDENRSYSKYSDGIGKASKKEYFSEKKHKCSECSFQTNYKSNLKPHLNTHNNIKTFECDICKQRFSYKTALQLHVRNLHSNTSKKEYKCSKCSYQTSYKGNLKRHLSTHNDIKPFECDICKKRFTQKSHLKMHTQNIHSNTSDKEYKCSECSYQTNRKDSFKGHLNTHHDINPFECDTCNKRFTHKNQLKKHIEDKHLNTNEKVYKCPECSYQTNYKSNLKPHLNTHNNIKSFECNICKKRYSANFNLKQHIQNIHSNINIKDFKCLKEHFRCSESSYQTSYKDNLRQHLNTHHDIKIFECDICKKRCSRKSTLIEHVRNKHSNTSEKEYKCSDCFYQTNYKSNFRQHFNTHHNNINITKVLEHFRCDICKKTFTQKRYLNRHIIYQHSNASEKEYKCPMCPYQTIRKYHMKQHIDTHSDIKPFACDICKKRYGQKRYLKFHIQNVHSNASEKKYKCFECVYETNIKFNFSQHLNIHKPFECDICKKRFSSEIYLNRHFQNECSHTSEYEIL